MRRIGTRLFLFGCVLSLGLSFSTARAAITAVGDVSPEDPSKWGGPPICYIGKTGYGSVTINAGSDISSFGAVIGDASGAIGLVTIAGDGSTWTNSGIAVGSFGSGMLNITGGGVVSTRFPPTIDCAIGMNSGSTGVVTVTGTGSKWNDDGSLYIGRLGNGLLRLSNGGEVVVSAATYVAYGSGSTGAIEFGPGGGTLTTQSLFASPAQFAGTGTVSTRGLVTDTELVFDSTTSLVQTLRWSGSAQDIVVSVDLGTAPSANGDLGAGWRSTGSLIIQSGTSVVSSSGYLGYLPGSTGVATIEGPGTTWTNSGTLHVGRSGNGTLNISGGACVFASEAYLGYDTDSSGRVNFGTGGGTLTANSLFASPHQMAGTGTINARGLVSDTPLVFDSFASLSQSLMWNQSGQNVTVNLDMASDPSANGVLGSGWRSNGSLAIQGGIVVASSLGYLGYGTGAIGVATVSGTSSNWTISDGIYTGHNGTGTLSIVNGGTVTDKYGYIGYNSGSKGEVTVDGTGSKWDSSKRLNVGGSGYGLLHITNGGAVTSQVGGDIGCNIDSTGEVTVDGIGSMWSVGGLNVGTYGSGA
jgi:fibronectin-binding autotransporter adhesin